MFVILKLSSTFVHTKTLKDMTKCIIKCDIPTSYQLGSLSWFNLDNRKSKMNGSYSAYTEFDTIKEAKSYLVSLVDANIYDEEQKKEMLKDIKKYGSLTYDAATASIETN